MWIIKVNRLHIPNFHFPFIFQQINKGIIQRRRFLLTHHSYHRWVQSVQIQHNMHRYHQHLYENNNKTDKKLPIFNDNNLIIRIFVCKHVIQSSCREPLLLHLGSALNSPQTATIQTERRIHSTLTFLHCFYSFHRK